MDSIEYLSDKAHVLRRPDTYIGSIEETEDESGSWILAGTHLERKKAKYNPALCAMTNELFMNSFDHYRRCSSYPEKESRVSYIKICIDEKKIMVENNGSTPPLGLHPKYGVHVPELIFGNLRAGENFDDTQKRLWGGRNGYGAKIANVFSSSFSVVICDGKQTYSQEWKSNMTEKSIPSIKTHKTKADKKKYVRIVFYPDLERFHLTELDPFFVGMCGKTALDMSCTARNEKLKIIFNGQVMRSKTFTKYVGLYLPENQKSYSFENERWQVCVSLAASASNQQVSFVNGICTKDGGEHVIYVLQQIVKKLSKIFLDSTKKKENKVQRPMLNRLLAQNLFLGLNVLIVNPSFTSQTKDRLSTKARDFGSVCVVTDSIAKKIWTRLCIKDFLLTKIKTLVEKSATKSNGVKKSHINIPKLEDAEYAGTRLSQECVLILTEGDSAKALAIAGRAAYPPEKQKCTGIFPLKGKLMNVRNRPLTKINGNMEIQHLKRIIGLEHGKVYEDTKSLRYGKVMMMTDQDEDGFHIRGLIINMFEKMWPSLLSLPDFLTDFSTPLLKVSSKKSSFAFYSKEEYEDWRNRTEDQSSYACKYYKGLGTSTPQEAREYFKNSTKHTRRITFEKDSEDSLALEKVFDNKKSEMRKQWLAEAEEELAPNKNNTRRASVSVRSFVDLELKNFSHASNKRALCCMIDGMKPSQRKILWCSRRRNLYGRKEIKVAQLTGHVSEKANYHHGEASLSATITGMAQDFVGTNNLPLLRAIGMFGTRLEGGSDAASARYISTSLSPFVPFLFPSADDTVLEYTKEDGIAYEPIYYVPIIPLGLINANKGIGTGWSSSIPQHNPLDIISIIKEMIQGDGILPTDLLKNLKPWYKGFHGRIDEHEKDKKSYISVGLLDLDYEKGRGSVSELPIGHWTEVFKRRLDQLIVKNILIKYKSLSTDTQVNFTLFFKKEWLQGKKRGVVMKELGMKTYLTTNNMVGYDKDGSIVKYKTVEDILKYHFGVRMERYELRKNQQLSELKEEIKKLSEKETFIALVCTKKISLIDQPQEAIVQELDKRGLKPRYNDKNGTFDYHHFLSLPLSSLTLVNRRRLGQKLKEQKKTLNDLETTLPAQMWSKELGQLEKLLLQDGYKRTLLKETLQSPVLKRRKID